MNLQTVFWKEEDMYVIKEVITGVTTQGYTMEEALANIKEAVGLYIEEMPEAKEDLSKMNVIGAMNVEIP